MLVAAAGVEVVGGEVVEAGAVEAESELVVLDDRELMTDELLDVWLVAAAGEEVT